MPEALAATSASDPASDWRTPARAGSAPYKSLWEALRYYYRRQGLSVEQLKQLSFCLRWELLAKVQDDLVALKSGQVVQPQRPYAEVRARARWMQGQRREGGIGSGSGLACRQGPGWQRSR